MKKFIVLFLLLFNLKQDAQNFKWVKGFGNMGPNRGTSIAVDRFGNIYTSGLFYGAVSFGQSYTLTPYAPSAYAAFVLKQDSLGNVLWVKQLGYGANSFLDKIDVKVDSIGNVYIRGDFTGVGDFDPGVGTYSLQSYSSSSVFISKLDANGNFLWVKQIKNNPTNFNQNESLALDDVGSVYLTGAFEGTVDFDPGAATYSLNSVGYSSIFILKLDADGNFVWVKSIDGNNNNNVAYSIAVDLFRQVYLTGWFAGSLDADPGLGFNAINSNGSKDAFVLKLDSLGSFIWVKNMGGVFSDAGQSIAVDAQGNVYTIGSYSTTVDFDPGIGVYNLLGTGTFISKLDALGNFVWAKALNGDCWGTSIRLDHTSNIYISGGYSLVANYDNGAYIFNPNGNLYLLKLDANANFIQAAVLTGTNSYLRSIIPDNFGNCYLTGNFFQTIDFDPNPTATYTLQALNGLNIFVLKLGSGLTTGIQTIQSSQALALKIYPNPNNGEFTIESEANIPLNIINSMGQLVAQVPASNKTELNIENLPPGIYFVLGNTTRQYVNQKIIVVR